MNYLRFLCLLALFIPHLSSALSVPVWVEVRDPYDNPPEIIFQSNTADSVVFTVLIPGFFRGNEVEGGETYQKMWFPKETVLSDTGFPELPVISRLIAVPNCAGVNVSVEAFNKNTFNGYTVYPAPFYPPGMEPPVFVKNDSVYSVGGPYPDTFDDCSPIDRFREQRLVRLVLYPVIFSPATEKIFVYDSLRIKLTFDNATGPINENTGIFNPAAEKMFLNYDPAGNGSSGGADNPVFSWETHTSILGTDCDYLIITAEFIEDNGPCQAKIEELAQHRVDYNGFEVRLINVGGIPDWDEDVIGWINIRNCIRNTYNSTRSLISADHRLPFVLLVGDAWDDDGPTGAGNPLIPRTDDPYSIDIDASDHYYAELDWEIGVATDHIEDLAIGRLPVGTYNELANIVDKIISYETSSPPAGYENWKDAIALQAGHECYPENINGFMADLVNNKINSCSFKDYITYYNYDYNSPTCTVLADDIDNRWGPANVLGNWTKLIINGTYDAQQAVDPCGVMIFFYMGHGDDNDRLLHRER